MIRLNFAPENLSYYNIEEEVINRLLTIEDSNNLTDALEIGYYLKQKQLGGYKVTSNQTKVEIQLYLN